MWIDIAGILFISVTANHLGLVKAIEGVFKKEIPIINCPKCLTFWSVFVYGVSGDGMAANPSVLLRLLAISFLCAYLAIWFELLEGFIDTVYLWLYEKIYSTPAKNDTPAADSDNGDTAGSVS